ncbi:DUF5819 family protein [Virgibacillus sp. Bac330]|uniref:DUF5819 family protein n=1 Tax=Virgibacillus sp. Bac330 TaxID=2419841 RepID=UPI000EF4AABC|nr:DUF5819 family protein [Virgibacillus sp. Bac330]
MLKKIIILFSAFLFLIHFMFTAIYLAPFNPVKAKYGFIVNAYMEPLFSQNWKLFAPNPASSNNQFLVRAQFSNGETTEWTNLTSFMIEKNYKNRFTPYNRLVRIQRGAFMSLYQKDDVTRKLSQEVEERDLNKEEYDYILDNEMTKEQEENGINILNRYAQSYVSSLYPEKDITRTQIVIRETKATPFSEQDNPNFENERTIHEFDWKEFETVSSVF